MKIEGDALIKFTSTELLSLHNWLVCTEEYREANRQLDTSDKIFLAKFQGILKVFVE